MKNLLTIVLLFTVFCTFAQTTITLQPGPTTGKDAMVDNNRATSNFGTYDVIPYWTWTSGGNGTIGRSFMNFDISGIPGNAVINSARLVLSSVDHPAEGNNAQPSGPNDGLVQRVTSTWSESTINWSNQPSVSTLNQVAIPASSVSTDVFDLNVTNLIIDTRSNPSTSFGFMIKLADETAYRRIVVASSNYTTDVTKRPKLIITYTIPSTNDSCITIRKILGTETGFEDAMTDSKRNTSNFGAYDVIPYWAWTSGGITTIGRSFIKFPMNAIPSNAQVTSATLTLYSVNHTAEGMNAATIGSNDGLVQRVIGPWSESTIIWDNKPTTDPTHQAPIAASTNYNDILSIPVTDIVKDMLLYPTASFGFMTMLSDETIYKRIVVASHDNAVAILRPKLEVCYKKTTGIATTPGTAGISMEVIPNPSTGQFTVHIQSKDDSRVNMVMYSINGQKVFDENNIEIYQGDNIIPFTAMPEKVSKGIYFITISNAAVVTTTKVVIQ